MLRHCYSGNPNPRVRQPKTREVTAPPSGTSFESRAFAALFNDRRRLRIRRLWRCTSARIDGYLETSDGELVLVESKQVLGWGSVSSAVFEILAGRNLLGLKAERGIIVFERVSKEWSKITPGGGWGQLALHAQEVASHISLGALQVTERGQLVVPPCGKARAAAPTGPEVHRQPGQLRAVPAKAAVPTASAAHQEGGGPRAGSGRKRGFAKRNQAVRMAR